MFDHECKHPCVPVAFECINAYHALDRRPGISQPIGIYIGLLIRRLLVRVPGQVLPVPVAYEAHDDFKIQ